MMLRAYSHIWTIQARNSDCNLQSADCCNASMLQNVDKNIFRYNVWNICLPKPPHPKDEERNSWPSHQGLGLIFVFFCISFKEIIIFLNVGAATSWIQGLRFCRGTTHHLTWFREKIITSFYLYPFYRLGLMEQQKPMESLWSRALARWPFFKTRCLSPSLLYLNKGHFHPYFPHHSMCQQVDSKATELNLSGVAASHVGIAHTRFEQQQCVD